ncbi:hypothetical protein J132_06458, partial [Termitomyces sp. J132]
RLTWDPDIRLCMKSANKQVNESVGLAHNVPFIFAEGFTVYLQVHIFEKPAYTVLLGRPFDTLTESNIQNLQDGSAIITIKDPNTIIHSLEPLNKVTIAHSGLPPTTEELAGHFASCACSGILDLYNVNCVLQHIKYAGGTFSGKKSVVCADEIVVVNHRCSYKGQKPETKRFEIFQEHSTNPKQWACAKLGSITLNEQEARFSQPKQELYGLMRALQANYYWLVGCRKLVVETDAKYLKGMLSNPGVGSNATIMRWIEDVLLYHFTLRHVPRKTFSVDGLSRRTKWPGDEEYQLVNPELMDEPNEGEDWDNLLPLVKTWLQSPGTDLPTYQNVSQKSSRTHEDCTKWFWVMWSDHIIICKQFGCSLYFMVTGAHPIIPLDLAEATWLVELPKGSLSTEELIGYQAWALAKQSQHVEEMQE